MAKEADGTLAVKSSKTLIHVYSSLTLKVDVIQSFPGGVQIESFSRQN
jgi:hypothetical protein